MRPARDPGKQSVEKHQNKTATERRKNGALALIARARIEVKITIRTASKTVFFLERAFASQSDRDQARIHDDDPEK
jgi:hypothetical protein